MVEARYHRYYCYSIPVSSIIYRIILHLIVVILFNHRIYSYAVHIYIASVNPGKQGGNRIITEIC